MYLSCLLVKVLILIFIVCNFKWVIFLLILVGIECKLGCNLFLFLIKYL